MIQRDLMRELPRDVEAEITLVPTEHGGRASAARSDYRPQSILDRFRGPPAERHSIAGGILASLLWLRRVNIPSPIGRLMLRSAGIWPRWRSYLIERGWALSTKSSSVLQSQSWSSEGDPYEHIDLVLRRDGKLAVRLLDI